MENFCYLIGDVGGTHSRLKLMRIERDIDTIEEIEVAHEVYQSKDFSNFSQVASKFLSEKVEARDHPLAACFSLAGPVSNGIGQLTNLGWTTNQYLLAQELDIKHVRIINDFEACGYGLLTLPQSDLARLSAEGIEPHPTAPKAIIGAGTGLGEAILFHNGHEYIVSPGEGGHADFAPRNADEFDMLSSIKKKLDIHRVATERILSGPGLCSVYWHLTESHPGLENKAISEEIQGTRDYGGKIISKYALLEKPDELCLEALQKFVAVYGAEAGNVAIRLMAYGGIYIAGGIAPKIFDVMNSGTFMDNFTEKGRMRQYLNKMPVFVVKNQNIGLLGAKVVCRRLLRDAKIVTLPDVIISSIDGEDDSDDLRDESAPLITTPSRSKSMPVTGSRGARYEKTTVPVDSLPPVAWLSVGVLMSGMLMSIAFLAGHRTAR